MGGGCWGVCRYWGLPGGGLSNLQAHDLLPSTPTEPADAREARETEAGMPGELFLQKHTRGVTAGQPGSAHSPAVRGPAVETRSQRLRGVVQVAVGATRALGIWDQDKTRADGEGL